MNHMVKLIVISGFSLILSTSSLLAQAVPGAPVKAMTEEEKAKQQQIRKDCNTFLDRFVGKKWVNKNETETGVRETELTFQRVVSDQFINATLIERDASKQVTYEAMIVLTYNWGVGQYLYYVFESDGWSRMFMGQPSTEFLLVQGVTPNGMEHYRWSLLPDGNLERAYWKPNKDLTITSNPPDVRVVFTPSISPK